jgi:DNA-binding NarL/FixJ family response regulator
VDRIKLLVVDAREIFREGLAKILERQPQFEPVGTCATGFEAIEKAHQRKPDVVLLDTEINQCDYLEVLYRCQELVPQPHFIILTHSAKENDLFSAIAAGASAYLTKDVQVEDLVRDIVRVHAGDVIIAPPLATRLIEEFKILEERRKTEQKAGPIGLSKRELEVLSLVAEGASNKKIAQNLCISENTVKVHLSNILEKLQVNTRQQASIIALEKGVISKKINPSIQ